MSTTRHATGTGRHAAAAWRWGLTAGLAGWFTLTAASQHPNRTFDRFRRYDRSGLLIPNWRFFAPEPARHDFEILHRVLTAEGEETPWRETRQVPRRTWAQAIWFPTHRRDKSVFDTCHELLSYMHAGRDLSSSPAYRLISDFVETRVRAEHAGRPQPQGFQFLVVRHTGHDETQDPDLLLVSHFVELSDWSASAADDLVAVHDEYPATDRTDPALAAATIPSEGGRP